MENQREQQIEALKAGYEYTKRLQNGIESVIVELREERKEDTKEFLDQIMKGINWIIQVVNGTASLINEKEKRINKDEMNEVIVSLNSALKMEEDLQIAKILQEGIMPFLNSFLICAKEITGIEEN